MYSDFWIVIPVYNEQKLIKDTLIALESQTDDKFTLLIVNNNSTDRTEEIIRLYKIHSKLQIVLVSEKEKGTGAASDTGFKFAIKNGAKFIARTDGDALPSNNWVETLKYGFDNGLQFIGGRIEPRTDEEGYKWTDSLKFKLVVRFFERAPGFFYKESSHKYHMFMAPGYNMAIAAELYEQVGGFPRSSIDDTDEDLILHSRVCSVIEGNQAQLMKSAIVYGSLRRARVMGLLGILLWHWDRKKIPEKIDIR